MSNSVRPHRRQSTRFPSPWDSPGKNTGVGFHFLLQCMKSESEVAQSCPTLRDPMNRSMSGLSVHHQLPELPKASLPRPFLGPLLPPHPLTSDRKIIKIPLHSQGATRGIPRMLIPIRIHELRDWGGGDSH